MVIKKVYTLAPRRLVRVCIRAALQRSCSSRAWTQCR
nr:MAG TPA: hypothetical protein [Caudoviricetes sp.]